MPENYAAALLRCQPHHAARAGQTLSFLGATANDCLRYPQPNAPLMTSDGTDEQDRQDVARLCAGHDSAFNTLMGRHAERLFHYLLRQSGNEAEASDLAQETFVRVYQNRARFNPAQKFSTWLFAIATNL